MVNKKYLVIGLVIILTLGLGCVDDTSPKSGAEERTPTTSPVPTVVQTTNVPAVVQTTNVPTIVQTEIAEPSPIKLSGSGQRATSKFSLEKGLSIFNMKHSGSSNFAIWLMDSSGDKIELLVNEIGAFDGSKAVKIQNAGDYILDINADGPWDINIEQPRSMSVPSVKVLTGNGQKASERFYLNSGLTTFTMKHDGDSNFAIWLLDQTGKKVELLVNEIGTFDGSKAVGIRSKGVYLFDINADGNWQISIDQ